MNVYSALLRFYNFYTLYGVVCTIFVIVSCYCGIVYAGKPFVEFFYVLGLSPTCTEFIGRALRNEKRIAISEISPF